MYFVGRSMAIVLESVWERRCCGGEMFRAGPWGILPHLVEETRSDLVG
jgi:hypothetical protein